MIEPEMVVMMQSGTNIYAPVKKEKAIAARRNFHHKSVIAEGSTPATTTSIDVLPITEKKMNKRDLTTKKYVASQDSLSFDNGEPLEISM